MRITAGLVTVASFVATAATIFNAFLINKQFYPAMVYLTKSNASMAVGIWILLAKDTKIILEKFTLMDFFFVKHQNNEFLFYFENIPINEWLVKISIRLLKFWNINKWIFLALCPVI